MPSRPSLETIRLLLRPFELTDAPAVARLAGEREIAEMTLNIPHPYELDAAVEWIEGHRETFESGDGVQFAIVERESGSLAGAMSIMAINQRHARAEIGYWTAKSYWGRGFCTEAATAVLEYGFTALSLNRIQASVLPRNPASRRVLEKLGMQCEGLLRQYIRKHEIYEDLWMYSILVADWRMRRNGKSGGKLAG